MWKLVEYTMACGLYVEALGSDYWSDEDIVCPHGNVRVIDTDTEAAKRENIINKVKEVYGEDKVLNFATFTTIGTRAAIKYAGRGLGIDNNEVNYIVSLLPADGHDEWPITDALLGNEKKGRKPSNKLLSEVNKYPNMKETIIGLFGLVVGRSEHASGVLVANNGYTEHNAAMLTPNGIAVTQFDADDSEYAGMIKFDFLSLSALDKVHCAIDMLVKDGLVNKQDTLRETYMKYFGPEALDMTNPEMYKMLFDGKVIDAFEFSSSVGYKTLRKLNARDYMALVSANGLMRLTGGDSDELALDRFIRYQNNPSDWDGDMNNAGLNDNEKRLMHKLLDDYKGVNNSQERLMQMVLKISDYSLQEANKLRKSIAKKDKQKQEEQHVFFLKKAKEHGLRDEFAKYVWDEQIAIQSGYAFSVSHSLPYTLILMVEMNICYRFDPIYWQTAVLSVNAKTYGDEMANPDYNKLATAIGQLPKGLVTYPDINRSEVGFVPKITEQSKNILLGLNAISGIGTNEIESIMDNRPYDSLDDFIDKNKEVFSIKKMILLIKSGAFNHFESDRRKLMIDYISEVTEPKAKLTTVQIKKIKDKIPEEYELQKNAYLMKKHVKDNDVKLDSPIGRWFLNTVEPLIVEYENGLKKTPEDSLWSIDDERLVIDTKRYDKWFNVFAKPLKEWLKTPEAVEIERKKRCAELWTKECKGNPEHWAFEALNFYPEKHELEVSTLGTMLNYQAFNDLEPEPKVIKEVTSRNGRKFSIYENHIIAGTIVAKNNIKSTVSLLTPDGLAIVSLGRQLYAKLGKKEMVGQGKNRHCVSDSWLERGNKLVVTGYRQQDSFRLRRDHNLSTTAMLINGYGSKVRLIFDK